MSASVGSGHYVGTVIDGKWWKRYRAPGYFARGNGSFAFDDEALRFHRALTKESTVVPLAAVTGVTIGTWHAGKWNAGTPIVKIAWTNDGLSLSSGFGFADQAGADAFVAEIERRRRARPA